MLSINNKLVNVPKFRLYLDYLWDGSEPILNDLLTYYTCSITSRITMEG